MVAGLLVALGLGAIFDVKLGHTLGIFAGSMTSTATLQAALDTIGNREPSIGYSVAYPFGVIGPILCFYFLTRRVKPVFPPKPARFHMGEVTIERLPAGGATLGAVMATLPEGVQVAASAGAPQPPAGSGGRVAPRRRAPRRRGSRDSGGRGGGRTRPRRAGADRQGPRRPATSASSSSKPGLTGKPLAELPMPEGVPIHLLHVRRYDVDLVPSPDLMLEIRRPRWRAVAPGQVAVARAHFGDTVKATADFSYVSIGLGMVMGVLLGLCPFRCRGSARSRSASAVAR